MDIRPDTLDEPFENCKLYFDFVEYYVSAVIGLRYYEKEKLRSKFSDYVTVSDEAFAVLTLENNWTRWMAMAVANHYKESSVKTRWTVTRDKKKGSGHGTDDAIDGPQARRYRGWSAHGINRYNQLFDDIKKERQSERGRHFENKLLLQMIENNKENKNKRKRIAKELPTLPMPKHELWVDTPVSTSTAGVTHENEQETTSTSDESSQGEDDELH